MTLSLLEAKKLEMAERAFGQMTFGEALTLASEAEQFAKDCGPLDQAYSYFKEQQVRLERYAGLLEAAGR